MKRFNKIINGFSKTIKKLEDLKIENLTKADDINMEIDTLQIVMADKVSEAAAAGNVAKKLKDLIGG